MADAHPSNDIASNIDTYFKAPSVEDTAKQTKLDGLETDYRALANKVVADVCSCADRSTSLRRLRESFDLSVSSLVEDPVVDDSWPPVPAGI